MAEIVNLRNVRKRRQREVKERGAEANRRLHGMTKEEAATLELTREIERKRLDAHRREGREGDAEA